jgi:hypothetical protein
MKLGISTDKKISIEPGFNSGSIHQEVIIRNFKTAFLIHWTDENYFKVRKLISDFEVWA